MQQETRLFQNFALDGYCSAGSSTVSASGHVGGGASSLAGSLGSSSGFAESPYGYGNVRAVPPYNGHTRNASCGSLTSVHSRSRLQGLTNNSNGQSTHFNGLFSSSSNGNFEGLLNGYSHGHPDLGSATRTHVVRKLFPDGGSNKENDADSVMSIDGYSGRSLLDAFYNKDIKSKLSVTAAARLSDGDTASFSSACSLSPPQQSVFRNSSGSDASMRSSPPQPSLFRTPQMSGYQVPARTSPPGSVFRLPSSSSSSSSSTAAMTAGGGGGVTGMGTAEDGFKTSERLSPSSASQNGADCDSSGGRSDRRDSVSTVGESVLGEDPGTDLARKPLFYQCDEFYFITDPEDHIYQHYPDDPAWQLLEVPITMSEFLDLPVVKSPFFNAGLKFASHYDCKQYTHKGEVTMQLKIPRLLTFGYTLVPRDKRVVNPNSLEGRVLLRIIGHKAMFSIAPPKRGRYHFTIYVKDESGSELLQSACAFQITCREGRETIKSPYPKVCFFGPTQSMANYGLLPQTHIDPLVSYNHDDINFQFAASRAVRLSYSLTFHCQRADAIDADLQRYAFLRHRDDTSMALQVRCPHVGKYVFSIYGAKSANPEEPDGQYECLFRYLIDSKQSATNKSPLPRACHRWCHSQLLEPLRGDLPVSSRVTFRVRAPLVCDMALLMGDAWYHFRQHPDHIWEACLTTSHTPCVAKLYARLNRETARFSPFLEFQIVGKES
ncbi:uncharacterized protein LOC101861359 [Aplysia californica]|uniref:Uncharacterized protein LOC101861359 n=1 Tax=Aplysia californica TaxID=6500 RepID=A0ABM0JMF7_APLCA|nr:uncharacterized protein LOC101861359 [Aplysia californica]